MAGQRALPVVAALLAAGGALLFVGGGWGLGMLAVAGLVGVLATGGWLRTVVGTTLVVVGLLGGLLLITDSTSTTTAGRQAAAIVGSLLVASAGLFITWFGRRWGSRGDRYDRDGTAATPGQPNSALEQWRALDRGEDPTLDGQENQSNAFPPRDSLDQ